MSSFDTPDSVTRLTKAHRAEPVTFKGKFFTPCSTQLLGILPSHSSKSMHQSIGKDLTRLRDSLTSCGAPPQSIGISHYIVESQTDGTLLRLYPFGSKIIPLGGLSTEERTLYTVRLSHDAVRLIYNIRANQLPQGDIALLSGVLNGFLKDEFKRGACSVKRENPLPTVRCTSSKPNITDVFDNSLEITVPSIALINRILRTNSADHPVLVPTYGVTPIETLFFHLLQNERTCSVILPELTNNMNSAHGCSNVSQLSLYLHDLLHFSNYLLITREHREVLGMLGLHALSAGERVKMMSCESVHHQLTFTTAKEMFASALLSALEQLADAELHFQVVGTMKDAAYNKLLSAIRDELEICFADHREHFHARKHTLSVKNVTDVCFTAFKKWCAGSMSSGQVYPCRASFHAATLVISDGATPRFKIVTRGA